MNLTDSEICKLASKGKSLRDIAAIDGRSQERIRTILSRNGIKYKGSRRGFSAMDPSLQREIARMGGISVHRTGRAHQFTSEEAREAGRKGGESVSRDRDHMRRIGRLGGQARKKKT